MKDDYTSNSHYLSYTFSLNRGRRMYFLSLGVKGERVKCSPYRGVAGLAGLSIHHDTLGSGTYRSGLYMVTGNWETGTSGSY